MRRRIAVQLGTVIAFMASTLMAGTLYAKEIRIGNHSPAGPGAIHESEGSGGRNKLPDNYHRDDTVPADPIAEDQVFRQLETPLFSGTARTPEAGTAWLLFAGMMLLLLRGLLMGPAVARTRVRAVYRSTRLV
jgi:hypothetical protein